MGKFSFYDRIHFNKISINRNDNKYYKSIIPIVIVLFLDINILWKKIIILFLLCALRSSTVNYYFTYISFALITFFGSAICLLICFFRPKNPSNLQLCFPVAWLGAKILGLSVEFRGTEFIINNEACVLTSNHQSIVDVVAISRVMNVLKKVILVSRKEVLGCIPFSLFLLLSGSIFIDRNDPKDANNILHAIVSTLLKFKTKLLIFPEGTRTCNPESLRKFKRGAFRTAIAGQIPISPLVISPYYFIDSKNKFFSDGHIIVKALKPIGTAGLTMDDLDSLMENTWNLMNDEYRALKSEVLQMKTN